MSTNKNLVVAKQLKNDEFYTQYKDIEEELKHYKECFKNKIVYCNCDNYEKSNFVKYFLDNFNTLGLKQLIATCYSNVNDLSSVSLGGGAQIEDLFGTAETKEINNDKAIKFVANSSTDKQIEVLQGNGDFRSSECVKLLDKCDIVVTNPPFSLFKEFVPLIESHKKQFIVIGNMNAVTYMEIFSLIKNNRVWKGISKGHYEFITDYETMQLQNVGGSCWFTNIDYPQRHKFLYTGAKYKKDKYEEYDNYSAINVDKYADIPDDYDGVMGVPITFLDGYCPEQFEIVNPNDYKKNYTRSQILKLTSEKGQLRSPGDRYYINGKRKFARIFIKRILY